MNRDLGARIKSIRIEKSLTQDALSKRIHRSSQVISNWERGYSGIEANDIFDILVALDVSPNYLFGYEDKKSAAEASAPSHSDDLRLTAHEREHITLYRQLDDEYRSIIDRLTRDNAQDAPSSPSTSSETGSRSGSGIKENRRPA